MEWLKSLYEFLGSQYPRLSLLIAAAIGAVLSGGGWWLLGKQYEKDSAKVAIDVATHVSVMPSTISATQSVLSPAQQRLLELVSGYQRQFAATKLIIGRASGTLVFDEDPKRGGDVNLLRDLYGSDSPTNGARFEQLVESMPPEYIRLLPEMRWDSPFVVSVTEAGQRYLQSHK